MTIHAQALLFDNDGTLVSSLDSVERCWARWAAEYGVTDGYARVELHGRTAADIVADLLPAHLVPEAVARVEQLEVEDVPNGASGCCPAPRPSWTPCPPSAGPSSPPPPAGSPRPAWTRSGSAPRR